MNIMVGIGHPKQVHLWKNIIKNLQNKGHNIKIVTWDKDITLYLLNAFGLEYEVVGINYKGLIKKGFNLFSSDLRVLTIAREFKPDILLAGAPYLAHVSRLIRKPHISFTDTEHANLTNLLSFPFTDYVITPSCYSGKIDPDKHIEFNGFMELTYLHPNYFIPDPAFLEQIGLNTNDKFAIVRFVAWDSSHDISDKGFDDPVEVVKVLERYCKVFITSEIELPIELDKYQLNISPEIMHHLMYYANIFIGESASMACESAILGTPAIFVSTSRRGYTDELESQYDMVYTFSDPKSCQENALDKAVKLLSNNSTKKDWQDKRKNLLKEKVDVTKFIIEFVENYTDSFI
ncbi:MAG: DUF354 domain-containing protein [Candidatus Methanomarinus sp.]|uniref:DUF354 domain-containing protein n=1 Tax=Candidatus Methanomarinus sp. TaxID=3386244 RepID=A0AC61SAX4_9EURY|nr:MAG: DUF354 domain-containing protein [ANME-2 cluster archaeon]